MICVIVRTPLTRGFERMRATTVGHCSFVASSAHGAGGGAGLMLERARNPYMRHTGRSEALMPPGRSSAPPAHLEDGPRTGTYRSAGDILIIGTATTGRISFAGYAPQLFLSQDLGVRTRLHEYGGWV